MNANQLKHPLSIQTKKWCLSWLFSSLFIFSSSINLSYAQDSAKKVWQEAPLNLPAAPTNAKLLSFYQNPNQEFFIDLASLSLADDDTLRYTLIANSGSGAKTTSYEAIRCQTGERKFFAFGRANGSWSLAQQANWEKIPSYGVNQHHHILQTEYLCLGNGIAGSLSDIQSRFIKKQPLSKFK
jgi:hypothetical protein